MQKTAYEMRISDWSSDVCSSDLANLAFGMQGTGGSTAIANSYDQLRKAGATARAMLVAAAAQEWKVPAGEISVAKGVGSHKSGGSEERRVGEEGDSTCRSRWSPVH